MSKLDGLKTFREWIDEVDRNILLLLAWEYKKHQKMEEDSKALEYVKKTIKEIIKKHKWVDSNILLTLLLKRFKYVKKVWEYKKKHNIQTTQQNRFQELKNKLKELWKKHWLEEKKIESIWDTIHHYSVQYQNELIAVLDN